MTLFLSYLINGISLGSVYAIIALGYTMVYGIAKMLNFAHGDVTAGTQADADFETIRPKLNLYRKIGGWS